MLGEMLLLFRQKLPLVLLVFFVGAGRFFDFQLIARVPLSEILAFGSLPFIYKSFSGGRAQFLFICALLFWLLGIILSDLFNDFVFFRFIRAFNRPIFCLLWLLFFRSILIRDSRLLSFYCLGLIFASLQNYLLPRSYNELSVTSDGYVAVAVGLVPIVVSVAGFVSILLYRKSWILSAMVFVCAAGCLLVIGAPRNNPAVMLLVAFILLAVGGARSLYGDRFKLSPFRLFSFVFVISLAALTIYYTYVWAASQGLLGEFQYAKLMAQKNTVLGTNPIGIILAGRPQVFAAILGILDKPFLGHGSWTGVWMAEYFFDAISIFSVDSTVIQRVLLTGEGAAGHSIFFQGWLENGILAALGLGILGYLMWDEFVAIIQADSKYLPFLVLICISFFWAFLFSPFGVESRTSIGLVLAFRVLGAHRRMIY